MNPYAFKPAVETAPQFNNSGNVVHGRSHLHVQLQRLRAEIDSTLAALDAQKVALLEEKLAMQGQVQAALDTHLKLAQAPVDTQRSALVGLLQSVKALLSSQTTGGTSSTATTGDSSSRQRLQELVAAWSVFPRALVEMHMPPLAQVLAELTGLQPAQEALQCGQQGQHMQHEQHEQQRQREQHSQDPQQPHSSDSRRLEMKQTPIVLAEQLQVKDRTIGQLAEELRQLKEHMHKDRAALYEGTDRDDNVTASDQGVQGKAATNVNLSLPYPSGSELLRRSLGLEPHGSASPSCTRPAASPQGQVLVPGEAEWQVQMRDSYRRMLSDLQQQYAAKAAKVQAANKQEMEAQAKKVQDCLEELRKQTAEVQHWQQKAESLQEHANQLESMLHAAQAELAQKPSISKAAPGAGTRNGTPTKVSRSPQRPPLREEHSIADEGKTAPLTLQGLANVLAEASRERECAARLQLYRLQEQYEDKLQALKAGLQQRDADHAAVLHQLVRLRMQLLQVEAEQGGTQRGEGPGGAGHTPNTGGAVGCRGTGQHAAPRGSVTLPAPGLGTARHHPTAAGQALPVAHQRQGHSPSRRTTQQTSRSCLNSPIRHRATEDRAVRRASASQGVPQDEYMKASSRNLPGSHQDSAHSSAARQQGQQGQGSLGQGLDTPSSHSLSFADLPDSRSPVWPSQQPLHSWEGLAAEQMAHMQAPQPADQSGHSGALWVDLSNDPRTCVRCGLNDSISPGLCAFHPALVSDPGPMLFGPEWQACSAAGHSLTQPPCYCRSGHTYHEPKSAETMSGSGSPAPQPRAWFPAPTA